jgi:D-alanyl-D-alanine carboxypeptidase/D-alanyl-D-alanine-endopeptidase (penicillin-binding protein 4)
MRKPLLKLRLKFWIITFLLSGIEVLAQPLPAAVASELARAKIPTQSISLLVAEAQGSGLSRLAHRTDVPMNPASVMKLVTTYAALDLLAPSFVWRTPVWLDGPVVNGVLQGNLVIQGQGDPKLVLERIWLLLRRVQGMGVQRIAGYIVLDRHAFAVPTSDPGEFDGEPLRPYNAAPDALLLNFKSIILTFTPNAATNMVRVQMDPPLAGVNMATQVPMSDQTSCADYRAALKADFSDPRQIRFAGSYPAACGEKIWPVAYADTSSYNARALEGLWRSMGGQLDGTVVDGAAPASKATFELTSPTLMEVIRDVNKFSNNVMAQQVFLTLGIDAATGVATQETSRLALGQWWRNRISASDVPSIDNGSGLSRATRISARQLGQLLKAAYASPWMSELMSSLPITGVDGTLKRSQATLGSAHLKTGSLREVVALAGYVHASSGRRYVLVAIVNHPNAAAARPALDALVDWTVKDNQSP